MALEEKNQLPLCVDLDETFCKVDTLWEVAMLALRRHPFQLAAAIGRFLLDWNRSKFKAALSGMVRFETSHLPIRAEVRDYVIRARAAGRRTLLVTGADQAIAEAVAATHPYFDEVRGSGHGINLKNRRKAGWLKERFGDKGYEYVGDCAADVPVWQAAGVARMVAYGGRIPHALRARVPHLQPLPVPARRAPWRILRPHQWVKNLLVFVPLAMAHRLDEPPLLAAAWGAFLALSLAASAVYILNDFLDVPDDRRHPEKSRRLIASGDVHFSTALVWGVGCVAGGLAIAWWLPAPFGFLLLGYWALAAAYALGLKRIFGIDLLILTLFYLLRLLLGAAAVGIQCSEWLLILAAAFFGSLALLKRYTEMETWLGLGESRMRGRPYSVTWRRVLLIAGTACALVSAAVFPFYIHSSTARELYRNPVLLLALVPLLLIWFGRMWRAAAQGRMHGDPVVFALKDPVNYAIGFGGLLVVWAAAAGY